MRERPSTPSRCASLYSCSRVLPPFDELEREVDPEREPEERDEPDELDRERDDFASPVCARCLFTVLAAISFARFVERPCFRSLSLTFSYCRSRLLLHAFGMSFPLDELCAGKMPVTHEFYSYERRCPNGLRATRVTAAAGSARCARSRTHP